MGRILFFLFLTYMNLSANEPFYALSSLKFFIEEGQDSAIHFEESDIHNLWEKALLSVDPKIGKAWDFYPYDKLECLKLLKEVWLESQLKKTQSIQSKSDYLHLDDNATQNKKLNKKIKPYLIPNSHSIKPILDSIFCNQATLNESNFNAAKFITLGISHANFLRIALHPNLPGYLFKIYLDDETRTRNQKKTWECLVDRCIGAENIRNLIKKEKLRHFIVPDKWIYPLQTNNKAKKGGHPVVLVETFFDLASPYECIEAWKQATPDVLDELYCILSHGYASAYLGANIPYTKNGKFACIDTEYPKRKIKYGQARQFFSENMQIYWDNLVKKGGK